MQTSYFAKYKGDKGVCIALYKPKWWSGRHYTKLAPPSSLLQWWKTSHSPSWSTYVDRYINEVLDGLDAAEVVRELGDDSVLLCYERSGDHCHRHIVSRWIERSTGILVTEIGVEEPNVKDSKEGISTG